MTTEELLSALASECPNGVSFDPMAVRLLRQKVQFEDSQIGDLKDEMFQLRNGLWFTREMISDAGARLAIRGQASEWLMDHGCFSVERLFVNYRCDLNHIATPEDCATFLRHLGFTVAAWSKGGFVCFRPPSSLGEHLSTVAKTIAERIDETDGTLPLSEIEAAVPYLTTEALNALRAQFLPEIHPAEVGGVPCWRSAEAIPLPEDFAEKLTTAVDTLIALEEKVSVANLEFALNLYYCLRFRDEYSLTDNKNFLRVCAKHYHGGNEVFLKKTGGGMRVSASGERRSPTRFRDLGVPVGAELVYTEDSRITCTVQNEVNKVEYDGKSWAISALAMCLREGKLSNGFCFFRYENETLWDRRLRLEGEGTLDVSPVQQMPSSEVRDTTSNIIGVNGRPLSATTWLANRIAGTSPRIADWARRYENGESVESIAIDNGLMASTVKDKLEKRRRYFDVCKINGIAPEGGVNV